jgi:hypothetical protein
LTPAAGLPYNFDPTDVSSGSIHLDQDWENPTLIVNGYDVTKPQVPFKLPFLSGSDQGIFLEFVSLTPHLKETYPYFDVQIKATVKVGDLSLETMLDLEFHYEHFAFKVVDKDGIKLRCSDPIHGSFKGLEVPGSGRRTQGLRFFASGDRRLELSAPAGARHNL